MELKTKRIGLIDMDGTTADFSGQMMSDLKKLHSPFEPPLEGELETMEVTPHLHARMSLIKDKPKWWYNLPKIPLGFEIVDILREFDFDLHIATKGPRGRPDAWAEKVKWCHKHIPDASVHVVDDKSLLYGKVLVDDWPAYVEKWLEWRPRGLVVMPAYGYNAHLEGHPNILRVKGKDELLILRERLATL